MVPPDEYRLWLWQTLANGGALKTPVFGTLDQEDRRNLPALKDAFTLIEQHPDAFVAAKAIAPVAVVATRHIRPLARRIRRRRERARFAHHLFPGDERF